MRVTFTSEGPEYWQFLGAVNLPHVVALYREHVSPQVQADDLLNADGAYDPGNR